MKKFVLVNLILLVSASLPAQLRWLNPTPSGWPNMKIHFINDSTGYLMNSNGDLFVTKDTGNTWQSKGNFPGAQTFQLHDSTGVIPCLDSSVYISSDNGQTWLKSIRSPGTNLDNTWCDIVGRDTIFVFSSYNNFVRSLYRSVDHGATWQLVNNNINQFNVTSFDFITSQRGYALKPGGIYKTFDGGVSWYQVYNVTTSANVICLKFYDTLRGMGYREGYGMLRTVDGGRNWTLSSQPTEDIYDIFYADSLNAYASGRDGASFKTTDGGATWTWVGAAGLIYAYDIYSQYFFNANDGIITGVRGRLLRTRNGGANWEWHSPTYIDVTGLSFNIDSTGYATTWNNIYKTTDAGNTWKPLALQTTGNSRFELCRFTSKDTGIVTTTFPAKVYKTTDGGQNWTVNNLPNAPYPPYDYVSSMSFFSRDTGYIALRGSTNGLLKTFDGGSNWVEIGTTQNFNLVFFLTDKFGYGTRYDRIYRTSDGGMNWMELPLPPASNPYKSLWFISPSRGFSLGEQGQLKMTVDSGYNWTDIPIEPNSLPDYTAIRFYNDKIGYITDDEGRYYKTTDGGYHWKKNGTVAFYDCRFIQFRPDTTVVFAGLYGAIAARDIADYSIDSVEVIPAVCNAQFKAKIGSSFAPVDSIWFQYGRNAYTDAITGTPVSVSDTTILITATVNSLQADSIYHMRVKIRFRNKYYYTPDFVFVPKKAAAPVIMAAGSVLSSSVATGNQWYLNGTLIPGATGQQYNATASGAYTVTATLNGCPTLTSAAFNLTVTALPDINAWEREIRIYPNPVTQDEVKVELNTNRRLLLQVTDIRGRLVREQPLRNGMNVLSLPELQPGMYIFIISDAKSFETVNRKVVKL